MAQVEIEVVGKDSFSGTLGNFGNIMTGIKSAIDLAGQAFQAFAGFANQGLDAIASYERLTLTLETLSAKEFLATGQAENMAQALSMSGDKAQELLDWMQQVAIKSPFTLEGVAQAFRMAEAYGFSADEAKRLVQALVDFAAGSGASEDTMSRIALALGQIQAKGKLAGQEVLQLVNAGLPVTQILADAFHVTTAEIEDMRTKGLIPADEAIKAITEYLETNFAGAAERQATSWAGLKGTFQDLQQMGLREFFGGLFDALHPLAIELSNFLQTEGMDKLSEWGAQLGALTQVFVDLGLSIFGGEKLYDLGKALQDLAGTDSVFYALGTAIRIFQQAIDDGLPAFDAIQKAVEHFSTLTGISIDTSSLMNMATSLIASIANSLSKSIDDWVAGGGPQELGDKVIAWVNNIGRGPEAQNYIGSAAMNLLTSLITAIEKVPWVDMANAIDQAMTRVIERHDWKSSGDAFGKALADFLSSGVESSEVSNTAIPAIGKAISDWFLAAMGVADWGAAQDTMSGILRQFIVDPVTQSFSNAFKDALAGSLPGMIIASFQSAIQQIQNGTYAENLGQDIKNLVLGAVTIAGNQLQDILDFSWMGMQVISGFVAGILNSAGNLWAAMKLTLELWILQIEVFLGIFSPSTLFMGIGKNIMQGMINGITSLAGNLLDKFKSIIYDITHLPGWEQVSNFLFGDSSGTGTTTGGGTTGTHNPGGTTTTSTGIAGVVNNYFYGPVYIGAASDLNNANYDCPSPNPLMTASSKSLLTSGIG